MRRVSSRQRLVSWDAFDATTISTASTTSTTQGSGGGSSLLGDNDNHSSAEEESYDTPTTPVVTLQAEEQQAPLPLLTPCSSLYEILTAAVPPVTPTTTTGSTNRWHCRKRERVIRSKKQKPEASSSASATVIINISISTTTMGAAHSRSDDLMDSEEQQQEQEYSSLLMDLVDDVQLAIVSFLDVTSLRGLLSTNKRLRRFLCSAQAHHIWVAHCQEHWTTIGTTMPIVKAQQNHHHNHHMTRVVLCDHSQLPTAIDTFERHSLNLPLLLSMTPDQQHNPTCIDKALIVQSSNPRTRRRRLLESQLTLHDYQDETNVLVQFHGQVGTGDRCIRANQPLPRPRHLLDDHRWDHRMGVGVGMGMATANHPPTRFLDYLCRSAQAAVAGHRGDACRPFVLPYMEQDGSLQCMPRMVSYYEVTILQHNKETNNNDAVVNDNNNGNDEDLPPPPLPPTRRPNNTSDCVAVGLGTHSFPLHSRMPGWDSTSFGYHGDDGGIFHASGGMVNHFGPSFGVGDTIGCGIDYVMQSIFFTLNGTFLGHGWKGAQVETFLQDNNDVYPVVGIDTNHQIYTNYGGNARPFSFDLTSYCAQHHEPLIQRGYQWKPFTSIPNNKITSPSSSSNKTSKRKTRSKAR